MTEEQNANIDAAARAARVRHLNDRLRRTGQGGRIFVTADIAALSACERAAIIAAVAAFDRFTGANDPYGEHNVGLLQVANRSLVLKVDAFDLAMWRSSPDPADPAVTCRVLTIMLAEEY